jgi:hypothetical protein
MKRAFLRLISLAIAIFFLAVSTKDAAAINFKLIFSTPLTLAQEPLPETPEPDSGYDGSADESPDLFEFFRRFIITDTPTPTPIIRETPTPTITPTKTPRPTATPVVVPPPSNPDYIRLMIGFGVAIVVVLLIGVWINLRYIR